MVCSKTKYASIKTADNEIRRINSISTRTKKPIRTYFCKYCKAYHLTSSIDYKKELEKEIQKNIDLKNQIKELTNQIEVLISKELKKEKKRMNGNPLVVQLKHENQILHKRIKQVRQDNQELIIKLAKLT